MPKHELVFDAGEYAPVADRITLFYARYPTGRILTRLISRTRRRDHRAGVRVPLARGGSARRRPASRRSASATATSTPSPVSRTPRHRPSGARSRTSGSPRHRSGRVARRWRRRTASARTASRKPRRARLTTSIRHPASLSIQRRADRVIDALDLLGQAERAGLTPRRARRLRESRSPASRDAHRRARRAHPPLVDASRHARICGCNTPVSVTVEGSSGIRRSE